ncbi:hypothetical protein [Myxococcus stipitatus]|uniref:hypothetical protein n=1 Tax=Myxococcus stipitatus TaxID=83455 RepID=UPI0030CFBA25
MADSDRPPPPKGLLARSLKFLGHLTHPETRSGKVFTRAEDGLTRALSRVSANPTYLRASGTVLRHGLNARIRRNSLVERALQTLRLPTASEVDGLRDQLRRVNDQVEALGSQLEVVVELLQRKEATAPPEPRPNVDPSAGT